MRKIEVEFETQPLTFTKVIEVPEDWSEEKIQKKLKELGEFWNWGDLGNEFNLLGEPQFDIDFSDADEHSEDTDLVWDKEKKRFV